MAKDDDVELEFQDDVAEADDNHAPDIEKDDPDLIRPEPSEDEEEEPAEPEAEKVVEIKEKQIPKPKPRKPAKDRIREISSQNHHLQERLIEMENLYRDLETKLQYSNMAATQHFEDTVAMRIDKAKQLKKIAYESGDVEAMTEADVEIAKATHAQQQSNMWKAQQQVQENNYVPPEQTQQAINYERDYESKAWAQQNTWFYPGSNDYDPNLARQVEFAASKFDENLRARGDGDLIGTRQYFQEIDKYVDSIRYDDAPQQRRSLRMKTQSHVSPAGRSSNTLAPSGENIKLSPLDAQWADQIGMSHKEYAKYIAKERQEEQNRRSGR